MPIIAPIKWTVEPHDITARAGERVVASCQADSFPVPSIKWIAGSHNGTAQPNLLIKLIKYNDYDCTVVL